MQLKLRSSEIFQRNYEADSKIVVNQGGTSSGKTYSILQVLLTKAAQDKLHISVCSLAMPHLRKGALKDFVDILTTADIYSESIHNKTDNIFRINNSIIEFFSLDQPGKARGPRRDVLFVNEANLIPYDTFQQLILRTKQQVYVDYNPADEFHWLYEQVLTRPDCTFIQSTYRDNPFLNSQQIKEIERLREVDENLWRVYGEGERGISQGIIYTRYQMADQFPDGGQMVYGLDFGFNNPTALVQVKIHDQTCYAKELLYQTNLTNSDLIPILKQHITDYSPIYADAAEPQRIEELYRAGLNVKPANKSVEDGIDKVKSMPLFIDKFSYNLTKEIKSYKYQTDKNGLTLDSPVKNNDHLMDAMRYAIHTHLLAPSGEYFLM